MALARWGALEFGNNALGPGAAAARIPRVFACPRRPLLWSQFVRALHLRLCGLIVCSARRTLSEVPSVESDIHVIGGQR